MRLRLTSWSESGAWVVRALGVPRLAKPAPQTCRRGKGVVILPARRESLGAINALIAGSKAHGRWPEGYLERALPLQVIAASYLEETSAFEVRRDRELAAFSVYRIALVGDGASTGPTTSRAPS